jgi:hypothetical protein
MQELFTAPFASGLPTPPALHVFVRLVLALVFGWGVQFIYRKTRDAGDITASFPTTLMLLAILIAMVTQVIGDNIARAFSLVGALSIVRFRTVVRDTQDTAYVIFAVVVGMAVGAGDPWVGLLGMGVVTVAALMMRPRRRASGHVAAAGQAGSYVLKLRIGLGHDLTTLVGPTLDAHLLSCQLRELGTAKQGIAIDASYDVQLLSTSAPDQLVKALNRIEGVQGVELQRRDVVKEDF